ncbi:MAG: bifunctional aspartate kinase/homoserine dehydrogenase I [Spirochaetes bacterium]|nr:bifunctional aspartate kinase/homoserine dehydrogenase I [Spirochaetota bacterium]
MDVVKFGGLFEEGPKALDRLVDIIGTSDDIIVVSSFPGVAGELAGAARMTETRLDCTETLGTLREKHRRAALAFLPGPGSEGLLADMDGLFDELGELLKGVSLLRDLSKRSLDQIQSFGVRLAAEIVAKALSGRGIPAAVVDAREIIKTDAIFGSAHWLETETRAIARSRLLGLGYRAVVPGSIGSTMDGHTTSLGRGGADLTASILGACLGAGEIQLWTDGEGMLTADPSLVSDAFPIDEISYDEALEMTHFGARAIDPPAFLPAMKAGIPIRILGVDDQDGMGTKVVARSGSGIYPVRGVASIPSVCLLSIEGLGMQGVTGIAGRMFSALARAKVNVILITQASSELSICCAVRPDDAAEGRSALREEFALEIQEGLIGDPSVEDGLSVIAVVGEQMKRRTGIAGRVFSAMGRNGVNVVAIAQGSSELNISIVTRADHRAKALNVIHDAFFLAGIRTVNLFLAGTGLIGKTLLKQIAAQREMLLKQHSTRIRLVGIINSRSMVVDPKGVDLDIWEERLSEGEQAEMVAFVDLIKALNLPSACFCDCTASDVPPSYYEGILASSIAIVTPNKRANSGPMERYLALKTTAREKDVIYGYETTVGAGLPVIGTLHDLVACGDRITRIEAVLSGTISFIFNGLGTGKNFSSLVLEAKAKGYTEPDPRDDLGAIDIARKTLILIREAGLPLDSKDIVIEPILPARLTKAPTVEEFLALLPAMDASMAALSASAASRGKVLRYVAVITPTEAKLSLQEYGPESPFYNLSGTDNLVMFSTARYSANPLVVRGPGAGADVTASGVFADILKTAQSYL